MLPDVLTSGPHEMMNQSCVGNGFRGAKSTALDTRPQARIPRVLPTDNENPIEVGDV